MDPRHVSAPAADHAESIPEATAPREGARSKPELAALAQAELDAGRYALARDTARRALALDNTSPHLWATLGRALSRLGEPAAARAAFDEARARTPESEVDARLTLLAECYRDALELQWQRVLDINLRLRAASSGPDELLAIQAIASLLPRLGREAEALPLWRLLAEQHAATDPLPPAGRWLRYARCVRRITGDMAEVEAAIERAIHLAPDDRVIRQACGRLLRPLTPPEALPGRLADLGFRAVASDDGGAGTALAPPVCAVPTSEFMMGIEPSHDAEAFRDERPAHRVNLPYYEIARFPVTVAEYARFVASGHRPPPEWEAMRREPEFPIRNVSWTDAQSYAAWLSTRTGKTWRLASEAEWEKAARWDAGRGVGYRYPWSDEFDAARCVTDISAWGAVLPIGSLPNDESPYGVRDLAGNVWEWTASLYTPYPLDDAASPAGDRPVAPQGGSFERVLRGGSWRHAPRLARATCRGHQLPWQTLHACGFRLVHVP